jgi:uncharacterized surface protein with fasciclin (FAS1) repeats
LAYAAHILERKAGIAMTHSRRWALFTLGALALSGLGGCAFYSEPPPVVIGGNAVAKDRSAMAALRASADHRRFVEALDASGVAEKVEGIGPITVFAPTDAAFAALRPKRDAARIAEDPAFLEQVLLGHIIRATLTREDFVEDFPQLNGKTKVFALNGQVVQFEGDPNAPRLIDLRRRVTSVTVADAIASNGIIHVVDNLLLPEAVKEDRGTGVVEQ